MTMLAAVKDAANNGGFKSKNKEIEDDEDDLIEEKKPEQPVK